MQEQEELHSKLTYILESGDAKRSVAVKESIEALGGGTTDNRSQETAGVLELRSVNIVMPAVASSALRAAIHCHDCRKTALLAGSAGTKEGARGDAGSGAPLSNAGT